jgi:hypothetical protein
MITRLSHATFFVLDQEKAYDFYVNKLGFKVHTDAMMDNGYRWLTVTPPEQPDMEIILMPTLTNPMMDEETRNAFKTLLEKGQLKAKGVQFKSEPKEQFYGIEAIMNDGCGNWFSMTQPKEH